MITAPRSTAAAAWLLLTALTLAAAQPVPYQGIPGGAAWQGGDFEAAYTEAIQVNTPTAQLLASRAATDQAVYLVNGSPTALEWLDRAVTAARRSLDLEPNGPLTATALMAEARAKGETGFYRSSFARAFLAGELQTLFESALELDPNNADALVSYAVWHYALTELGVGWLFGASRDKVLPMLERGIAAAPRQINLRVEYARVLFGLGRDPEAREQVEVALALPARTAADAFEQARARELLSTP